MIPENTRTQSRVFSGVEMGMWKSCEPNLIKVFVDVRLVKPKKNWDLEDQFVRGWSSGQDFLTKAG